MANETLLKVQDLSLKIDNQEIFRNVSFELHQDEVLAIIGPNGAGKSMLLKTLLGFFKPTSGAIEWLEGAKVGYLPQRFQIDRYLPMTVVELLALKPNPKYSLEKIAALVKMDPSLLGSALATISSGQLQKVLLAWSLIDQPNILFFDEPTENVDIVSQEPVYHLLHRLQKELKIATIIISHDLNIVYRYADNVFCLNKEGVCYGRPLTTLTTQKLAEVYGNHGFFEHHHFGEHHGEHHAF